MSESIVLNLDRSIALASDYWESLSQASAASFADLRLDNELPVKSLTHSLVPALRDSEG